jgi:hypothetical protein
VVSSIEGVQQLSNKDVLDMPKGQNAKVMVDTRLETSPPNLCLMDCHSDLGPGTIAGIALFVCLIIIAPMYLYPV